MANKRFKIGSVDCGGKRLFLIAGPCVIEEESLMLKTAEKLKKIAEQLKIGLIFKSSFQKDNRSSLSNYYGPGITKGLRLLKKIKEEFGLPVISDIHHPDQAKPAGRILDIVQIPAYLCMQTDLVVAAAKTGKPINLKHAQFLSPENIVRPVKKLEDAGAKNILLTERGYTFGYNDLVVDPRSFYHLGQTGCPVVFDITHSVRHYGISSADPRGSSREYLPTIARAGVAAGVDGIFIETHPDPPRAKCDASSQIRLNDLAEFVKPLLEIQAIVKGE